ncbi:hypothetical protein, partial [Sansalvadorimonas verongulae]|uniref:hypothetical protein n=1 Tax=Sansalvadorimonas verongulae TaxID=2172824 RepID=UPI0018AD25DA
SLVCQGVGSPSSIRLPRQNKEALELIAEAADDVIITGEFVDGFPLPFNPDINAWEIQCRKVVKQEFEEVYETASTVPGDLDYDSPTPEVQVLSQNEEETVRRGKQN